MAAKWRFIEGLLFARQAIPRHTTPCHAIPRHTAPYHAVQRHTIRSGLVAVSAHRPPIHRYEQKYQCPFRELLACSHSYAERTHSDYTEHSGKNKRRSAISKARLQLVAILSTILYLPIFMSPARPQPGNSRCHAVGNNELWPSRIIINYARPWCIVSRLDAKWKTTYI